MAEYLTDLDYAVAERNGISKKLAYQRFYVNCWNKERAITQPVGNRNLLRTWRPVLAITKIKEKTFTARVFGEGMKPIDAATTPLRERGKTLKGSGKVKLHHFKKAAENGIPEGTLHQRIRQYGWSVERACTEPVDTRRRKKG